MLLLLDCAESAAEGDVQMVQRRGLLALFKKSLRNLEVTYSNDLVGTV
jgi:hypothetical protein